MIDFLQSQLRARDAQALTRVRREASTPTAPLQTINGRPMLAFCSNDYLGLASHPQLIAALQNERKTSQYVKASTLDDRVFTDGKINLAELFAVLINDVINPSIPDRQWKEIRRHPDALSGERRGK